jgi:hypothetical protein
MCSGIDDEFVHPQRSSLDQSSRYAAKTGLVKLETRKITNIFFIKWFFIKKTSNIYLYYFY